MEVVAKIKEKLSDLEIIAILQVGSSTWGCENAHDTDYAVILKGSKNPYIEKRWISSLHADIFIYGDMLENTKAVYLRAYVKASQGDGIIYGELPRMEWADVRKRILKASYASCLAEINKLLSYPEAYPVPSKCSYYIWLNYYTEINGNFDLTDEQRAQVQRIHDKQGTLQDLFDIKNKYEKLFEVETDLLSV